VGGRGYQRLSAIRGWEQIEKKALACRPQDLKSFSQVAPVRPFAAGPRGLDKDRRIGVAGFLMRETAYFLGIRFAFFGRSQALRAAPAEGALPACPSKRM
jgi:hypothetical protein